MSEQDRERDFGKEVLGEWVKLARWYWPDEDVADMLQRAAWKLGPGE